MEALFLKVLNMSVTASYVIAAVLLFRLLLKRAPKKYAYLLWGVAAFRLCCSVSFSSAFSLFRLRPFDMTAAQSAGGAALQYLPGNLGLMAQPRLTVGIPAANIMINDSLPAAAPMTSVNPLQIWIFLGSVLWCLGMAALLLYSVVSLLRLRRRLARAVRLEGNVFEAEGLRSPFILGSFRPKIYLPFGLDAQTCGHVLAHERCHLQRCDHIVKPLAFLLLCVHWFNPLVWLAFFLMSRDMEQSCDERVLSHAPESVREYSLSLLSLAANRRFPAAGPLAFGETGVKARIKNALRFKRPALWLTLTAALTSLAVLAACAANPATTDESGFSGTYAFDGLLYSSPLLSYYPINGTGELYQISDAGFTILDEESGEVRHTYDGGLGEDVLVSLEDWAELFPFSIGEPPDISAYKTRLDYAVGGMYHIYRMDDELWLGRVSDTGEGSSFFMSLYLLKKET